MAAQSVPFQRQVCSSHLHFSPQDVLESKNSTIKDLQYELARVCKVGGAPAQCMPSPGTLGFRRRLPSWWLRAALAAPVFLQVQPGALWERSGLFPPPSLTWLSWRWESAPPSREQFQV